MIEKYDGVIGLFCTIPGIDRSSAITVISEIGVDMPEHLKEQQLQKAVKQAIHFLKSQGLKVS